MPFNVNQWYYDNLQLLRRKGYNVSYDDIGLSWIYINNYILPDTFTSRSSALMMETPFPNITNNKEYHFFMNRKLSRKDGRSTAHLYENSAYNKYRIEGYSRMSFHLYSFITRYPIEYGTTFNDILRSLYVFLGTRW